MAYKVALHLAPLFLVFASTGDTSITIAPANDGPVTTLDPSLLAAPAATLAPWNVKGVQEKNNCYAFLANDIDKEPDTDLAFPGQRTINLTPPQPFSSFLEWESRLIKGAVADGMIYTGSKPGTKPGYYRGVLLMNPDYKGYGMPYHHWLRQGPDGFWYGKDGRTRATAFDQAGHRIKDPAKAVFGWDNSRAQVIGYVLVPEGGLDVGNPNEPKTHTATRAAYAAPQIVQPQVQMISQDIVVTARRRAPHPKAF